MSAARILGRVGRVIVSLIALVLILAGTLKLANLGAEDMIDGLRKANLLQHKSLISVTAIVCGVLLMTPPTWRFGLLLASSYWGGAIVAHLTYNDSILMPAVMLSIMWLGGVLIEYSRLRYRGPDAVDSDPSARTPPDTDGMP